MYFCLPPILDSCLTNDRSQLRWWAGRLAEEEEEEELEDDYVVDGGCRFWAKIPPLILFSRNGLPPVEFFVLVGEDWHIGYSIAEGYLEESQPFSLALFSSLRMLLQSPGICLTASSVLGFVQTEDYRWLA